MAPLPPPIRSDARKPSIILKESSETNGFQNPSGKGSRRAGAAVFLHPTTDRRAAKRSLRRGRILRLLIF
jgi:hypothetical protein